MKVKDVILNVKALNKNPKIRPLSMEIDAEVSKNVIPKKLLFFSENGFIAETEIKNTGDTKFSVPVDIKVSDADKWLRVELWGGVSDKLDESYIRDFSNVALAGTAFFQITQKQ